jgi:hypothetical protein
MTPATSVYDLLNIFVVQPGEKATPPVRTNSGEKEKVCGKKSSWMRIFFVWASRAQVVLPHKKKVNRDARTAAEHIVCTSSRDHSF